MDEHTLITTSEKKALTQYADTLKILITDYPPQVQEDLLCKFSQEAGFINRDMSERIEYHKKLIERNYKYSQVLLALVEKLILR